MTAWLCASLLLAVVALPRPAVACTPAICQAIIPPHGSKVPANTPYYFVGSSKSGLYGKPTVTSQPPRDFAVGNNGTVTPKGAQPGDVWTLAVDATGCTSKATFTLGPEAPTPTAAGVLSVVQHAVGSTDVWTTAGSCTVPIQADVALFRLLPDASMAPWVPVAQVRFQLDGTEGGGVAADYGRWRPDGSALAGNFGQPGFRLYSACGAVPKGATTGLKPGTYQVGVEVRVWGSQQVWKAAPVTVTLACDKAAPAGDVLANGDPGNTTDAGSDAAPTATPPPASAGSCQARARAGFGGLVLAMLAVAWVLGRRRLSTSGPPSSRPS